MFRKMITAAFGRMCEQVKKCLNLIIYVLCALVLFYKYLVISITLHCSSSINDHQSTSCSSWSWSRSF